MSCGPSAWNDTEDGYLTALENLAAFFFECAQCPPHPGVPLSGVVPSPSYSFSTCEEAKLPPELLRAAMAMRTQC